MKAQHTPGPWTLDVKKRRVKAGRDPIADVLLWSQPQHQAANAKLIAAAPDLLEVAKFALRNEEARLYMLPASQTTIK